MELIVNKKGTFLERLKKKPPLVFRHMEKNKAIATLENMRDLLNYYEITCRYNVISKRMMIIVNDEEFSSENQEEAAMACIFSYMKERQLDTAGYLQYLTRIADENQFNPVLSWVRAAEWDGISRIGELCETIQADTPENEEAKNLLIRRWLLTAMAMARGDGVDASGILVLQGAQDMGKTWWVRKLVPEELRKQLIRTDATVDPKDKDSVSQVIGYWLVELGEIGATFRKADNDALKSFITRDVDVLRRPYGVGDRFYPRRTAFAASVDQTIYLSDTAGNRRFWTIPCISINSYHEIDMQQLWLEVWQLLEDGETSKLKPDEKEHIARINNFHLQINPTIEKLQSALHSPRLVQDWKTATEIGEQLGIKNVTQSETRIITGFLKKTSIEKKVKDGYTTYLF